MNILCVLLGFGVSACYAGFSSQPHDRCAIYACPNRPALACAANVGICGAGAGAAYGGAAAVVTYGATTCPVVGMVLGFVCMGVSTLCGSCGVVRETIRMGPSPVAVAPAGVPMYGPVMAQTPPMVSTSATIYNVPAVSAGATPVGVTPAGATRVTSPYEVSSTSHTYSVSLGRGRR